MAVENRALLNGRIESLKMTKADGKAAQATIGLRVARSPEAYAKRNPGPERTDVVVVVVRDEDDLKYLADSRATVGDMLEVAGTYSTLPGLKSFRCKSCGEKNVFEGTLSFVRPLCMRLYELKPKRTEVVRMTKAERMRGKEEARAIINGRKRWPGDVIEIKDLGEDADGSYRIRVTSREKATEEEALRAMKRQVSNLVRVMGNVCGPPSYNPIDNGGRVCTYQLGVNRKVYVREDDPSVKADFPWVKSLGDQADRDRDALRVGSLAFVEGSIQARDDFLMEKECEACGEKNKVRGQAMEIVPFHVKYVKNCERPTLETDDDEAAEAAGAAVAAGAAEAAGAADGARAADGPRTRDEMANKVLLAGWARSVRKKKGADGRTARIMVGTHVIRRPDAAIGNREGEIFSAVVPAAFTDPEDVARLEAAGLAEGDAIEIVGTYETAAKAAYATCPECGENVPFEEEVAYVSPAHASTYEPSPKRTETIRLTGEEVAKGAAGIAAAAMEKKAAQGEIASIEDGGPDGEGGRFAVVTSREPVPDEDKIAFLRRMGEVSDRAYLIGTVVDDPVAEKTKRRRVCEYSIEIDDDGRGKRRVARIRSLDAQAESDAAALRAGSYVFVDGSIMNRETIEKAECPCCGATVKKKARRTEIVPYAVEYLRNCVTTAEEDEDGEGTDEAPAAEAALRGPAGEEA